MKSKATFPRYLAIILICLLCLCPFVVLLILSLNEPGSNMYDGNVLIPDFYFGNYAEGWAKSNIGRAMINSGIITLTALLLIVFLGAMAGYAVARYPNKFNRMVFNIMLCCMMIPGIINTVPLYTLMIKIKAVNTLWGMACVCATLALPQAVFVFSGFIRALPRELEEAAVIDGCGIYRLMWHIVTPLMKNSIVTVLVLQFFFKWNDLLFSMTFISDSALKTVQTGLLYFSDEFGSKNWGAIFASVSMSVFPLLILYMALNKKLMEGMTAGAVKG